MQHSFQSYNPHSFAIFPITLTTTLSLIASLSYLQLLYGASFIFSLIRPSGDAPPALQDIMEHIEEHIVDLILRIIPSQAFRSPPSSCLLHEDPPGHRIVLAARSTPRVQVSSISSSHTVIPTVMLQCYPANSVERPNPRTQATRDLSQPVEQAQHDQTLPGPSSYATTQMCDQRNKAQAETPQLPGSSKSKSSQPCERDGPTEAGNGGSAAPVPDMPETPDIVENIPPQSSSEADESSVDLDTASTESDSTSPSSLPLSRSTRCPSAESYPGRFPTSHGIKERDFAMMPSSFRERGTTFVRPFSDY